MTSPNQPIPDSTSSVYSDVYAAGSSFGQDLRKPTGTETEEHVRNMLMGQATAPFEGALGDLGQLVQRIFTEVANAIGGIIGGVVEGGVTVFNAVVDGAVGLWNAFTGWVFNLFGRRSGEPAKPLPPIYSEIPTDIEAVTQPLFDDIDKSLDNAAEALEAAGEANQLVVEEIARVDTAIAAADSAAQAASSSAAQAADAASQAFQKAESALTAAGEANSSAQELNTTVSEMNTRIEGMSGQFGEFTNSQQQVLDRLQGLDDETADLSEDYTTLNNRLWGSQGELNRINNALWDAQSGWNATHEAITWALTAANEAQDEAIDALSVATRLAFPEYNFMTVDAQGYPVWASASVENFVEDYLPSGAVGDKGQEFPGGTTTYGTITVPSGVKYLRASFWHWVNDATGAPSLRLTKGNTSSYLELRWRKTYPDNPTEAASETLHEGWTTGKVIGAGLAGSDPQDPETGWRRKDLVIELPPEYTGGRLYLHTGGSGPGFFVDFRAVAYYPGQAATDLAQNRALHNIRTTLDGLASVTSELETVQREHGESIDRLAEAMAKTRSYIPRLMIVPDASYGPNSSKPYLLDDYVQVRFDSTTSLLVDARGSTWAGKIVVTANYKAESSTWAEKTQTRYFTFDIKDTGRTNGIPRKPESGAVLDNVRIDYYVEPGSLQVSKVPKDWSSSPYVAPQDPSWYEQTTDNFVFTSNTKEIVPHNVVYKVGWHSAARDNAVYKIRVRKVSKSGQVTVWPQEKALLGPRFPWEDGYREMTITTSVPMEEGDKLYFGFTVGTTGGTVTSDQRRVRNQERKVSWVAQSN